MTKDQEVSFLFAIGGAVIVKYILFPVLLLASLYLIWYRLRKKKWSRPALFLAGGSIALMLCWHLLI